MTILRTDVVEALQKAAIAAVEASSVPNMPFQALNTSFTVPETGKYVEFIDVANDRQNEFWGNERTFQGSVRLLLHWPINGEGAYTPSRYVDELGAMFPKSRIITLASNTDVAVKIYDHPVNAGLITATAELIFPLILPYRCFAT